MITRRILAITVLGVASAVCFKVTDVIRTGADSLRSSSGQDRFSSFGGGGFGGFRR